jgi:hypothetical protein
MIKLDSTTSWEKSDSRRHNLRKKNLCGLERVISWGSQ